MKTRNFLFLLMSVAILFTACKSNDPEVKPTGITLNKTTLTLVQKKTETLIATLTPTDATGTITWTSSNTAVATVDNNGLVTAVAAGTATVTASVNSLTATCEVTVESDGSYDPAASLTGSAYYPIILDAASSAKVQSKIVADLRPDEATKFLYVWENTYTAGTATGPNFYGEVEGWVSLVVGSVGWSGAGFNVQDATTIDKLADITANPTGYYLHIGIKSKDNAVHVIGLDGQSNVKFALGATAFNDNGTLIEPLADFKRDGEWHEIEIPMTTLKTNGLLYASGMGTKNVFWFLSGGVAGTTLDLDAVFIYKK
ncbi:conserved exported hypothetical protein [uncultured Paludibacter sp.]|uniref:BIG2 domain-containing protein n=1 Tax=uncultured Paludibacter sp. TaxID=497635 RepID=A0A653AKG4_9BACT|nr:conserved exported hypothetical protein [uncultured Paludibacter sp.]